MPGKVYRVSIRILSHSRAALLDVVSQPHEVNGPNVSPALSPDGKYIMFLSQRELISIDVFMADAVTGKSISYTLNAGSDTAKGFILLPYDLV